MANPDSTVVSEIKTARDAVISAIAEGRLTVSYTIRGRTHASADPTATLLRLEELLDIYERKVAVASRSPMRFARLQRPRGIG